MGCSSPLQHFEDHLGAPGHPEGMKGEPTCVLRSQSWHTLRLGQGQLRSSEDVPMLLQLHQLSPSSCGQQQLCVDSQGTPQTPSNHFSSAGFLSLPRHPRRRKPQWMYPLWPEQQCFPTPLPHCWKQEVFAGSRPPRGLRPLHVLRVSPLCPSSLQGVASFSLG